MPKVEMRHHWLEPRTEEALRHLLGSLVAVADQLAIKLTRENRASVRRPVSIKWKLGPIKEE